MTLSYISTVRSNNDRRIGFLKDYRRINVALSRARDRLVIVGDNFMMESATIGSEELNPFASVLQYMRAHSDECKNRAFGPSEVAMSNSRNDLVAVTSRAKRRFPDHTLDNVYPICVPIYELRLLVTTLAEDSLSTTARFILRLVNAGHRPT